MQLELALRRHGGARPGAGRKRGPGPVRMAHRPRAVFTKAQPVHVTLRVARDVRYLRGRKMYAVIRQATITAARQERCRIVQMSVQHDHVHLIVEADGRAGLAKGMQSFQVSAAKRMNSALSRAGKVFPDRYHAHVLRTPSEVRNALGYVLNNWRKHQRGERWAVDPYSSGYAFGGWKERATHPQYFVEPATHKALCTRVARTWLLAEGWRRAGAISAFAIAKAGRIAKRGSRSDGETGR